jgi:hypothetical protein
LPQDRQRLLHPTGAQQQQAELLLRLGWRSGIDCPLQQLGGAGRLPVQNG